MIKRFLSKLIDPDRQDWLNHGERHLRHALINLLSENDKFEYQIWFRSSLLTTMKISYVTEIYKNADFTHAFVKDQDYGISRIPLIRRPYNISLVKPSKNEVMIQIYKREDRSFIPYCNLGELFRNFRPKDLAEIYGTDESKTKYANEKFQTWLKFRNKIQYDWEFYDWSEEITIKGAYSTITKAANNLISLDRMDLIEKSYKDIFSQYI